MPEASTIDVSRLLDERRVNWFTVRLVIFSFLVVLSDGFDINMVAYAAPELVRAWGIADKSVLAPVFAASLLGMLFGAPFYGYIGDRFGRKKAIVASCLTFGIFTGSAVLATSLHELTAVRFMAGIGIGGLLPNAIALVAEFAPKRLRATMIILMFTGVSFGGAMPGPVAAWLVPQYGWPILFAIGGIVPILVALACLWGLPESIRYLVLEKTRRAEVLRLLAALRPDLSFDSKGDFILQDEKKYDGFSPRHLFSDGLGVITPLLWLLFVANLMGYYFIISWMPIMLAGANMPVANAALATSLFQIGGTIGGLAMCRPIDLKGLAPVCLLFAVAVPVVGSIGYVGTLSESLLFAAVFVAGFCVLGLQFGINATAGMIYPTSLRSKGAGWALGIGRLGAIIGPMVGGFLISLHFSLQHLYVFAAIPFLVGAIACFALARLYMTRFQGRGLGARDAVEEAVIRRA